MTSRPELRRLREDCACASGRRRNNDQKPPQCVWVVLVRFFGQLQAPMYGTLFEERRARNRVDRRSDGGEIVVGEHKDTLGSGGWERRDGRTQRVPTLCSRGEQ